MSAPGPPHTPAPRPRATGGDYGLLILLAVIFGSTYMFIGYALRSFPPLTLAASRVAIALAVLGGIALLMGERIPRDWRSWRSFLAMGTVGIALPFTIMTFAQQWIDTSLAAILITSMPLFTLTLAHLFTDDKASPRKLLGVLVGLAGILMLLGPAAIAGVGGSLVGQLMFVSIGLCYATLHVLIRRLGTGSGSSIVGSACSMAAAALWMFPLALIVDRPWTLAPRADAVAGMLALGLLSTALAHFMLFRLNKRVGPNFVAANNYLGPPVGMLWGVMLFGEEITWLRVSAMIVIFGGIALATTSRLPARLESR